MACCGPKLSLCCTFMGAWGVIQLGLMGLFYYLHSVAFAEDVVASLSTNDTLSDYEKMQKFYEDLDAGYEQGAYNCWIAAGLYLIVLLISVQQFMSNMRNKK